MDYGKEQETVMAQTRNPYLINYGEYRGREGRETGTEGRTQQFARRKESFQRQAYEEVPQRRTNRKSNLQEQERRERISRERIPQEREYREGTGRTVIELPGRNDVHERERQYTNQIVRRSIERPSREYMNEGVRRSAGSRTRRYADSREDLARNRRSRELARRRRLYRQRCMLAFATCGCILIAGILLISWFFRPPQVDGSVLPDAKQVMGLTSGDVEDTIQGLPASEFEKHPQWTENFLTLNEYSRPGEALPEVKNIFVHYTANKNTSAAQNRSYFENLKDNHETSASAHFIIGYEGEIIQCIPLDEIAYAVQTRNYDSVSIECCYVSDDGSFTQATYDSLISLLKWLIDVYDLDAEDVLRHYDCGGKKCPLYYTENPDAWERLKKDLS